MQHTVQSNMTNLKTIDCSECGKPVAYTFTNAEVYGHIRCGHCMYMLEFVAAKLGCSLNISLLDIPNSDGENSTEINNRIAEWKKNLWSSFGQEMNGKDIDDA